MMLVPLLGLVLILLVLVLIQQFYIIGKVNRIQDDMVQHQRRTKNNFITVCKMCEEYGVNLIGKIK